MHNINTASSRNEISAQDSSCQLMLYGYAAVYLQYLTVIPYVIKLNVIVLNVVMLSVVMLNVVMLSVIVLSVIMLIVIMLSVIILNVIMLSVIMLSVIKSFPWSKKLECLSLANFSTPGACAIKLFTVVIYGFFVISCHRQAIQPSLMFVGRAGQVKHISGAPL